MSVLSDLERLSRQDLIGRAQRLGVQRAELMTRVELTDEIVRLSESDPTERRRARGWLGIARDLLASVVEQGLHLPEAAALIRGEAGLELGGRAPAPVATVTLAEIYSAQGHLDRAVRMLDQVLDKEPDHDAARALRNRFAAERERRMAAKAASFSRASPEELESLDPETEDAVEPEPSAPESASAVAEPAEPIAAEPEPVAAEPEPVQPEAIPEPGGPTHDALVLMRSAGGRILVYWELRPESVRRAERRWPEGRAVVRVVGWRPSWEGAERVEHDVEIADQQDSASIDSLGDIAAIRAVLGWRFGEVLRPFSVACELRPGASPSDEQLLWAPPGLKAAGNLSTTAARALEHWSISGTSPDRPHHAF